MWRMSDPGERGDDFEGHEEPAYDTVGLDDRLDTAGIHGEFVDVMGDGPLTSSPVWTRGRRR